MMHATTEDINDNEKLRKETSSPRTKSDKEQQHIQLGCGILGRFPILSLLVFVIAGMGLGIGLSNWVPENEATKEMVLQWIGLIGDLFLRALKAIVLPIVFVNVIIAVVDMMMVGAAGGIGAKTVGLYLGSTLLAGTFGAIFASIFARWFGAADNATESYPVYITLGCNETNSFLTQEADGSVSCTSQWVNEEDIMWTFGDVNGSFAMQAGASSVAEVSLSDTIYEGVFMKLVTDNIFISFSEANFAAIVVFAIATGVALSKVLKRLKTDPKNTTFMSLLIELDQILGVMIIWVIMCTPFAVFSMIVAAIGGEDNLGNVFANVGLLVAYTFAAFFCHYFVTYCGGFLLLAQKNPFKFLRHIAPAQLMGFACSSSAATIPVTISSVLSTGIVPETIARFVIPLGATVNMDGTAIYFPCACVWLAVYNGITPSIADYILLVIISTFGSMGAAPVPNAGLALIVTSYNTVFNGLGTPAGFSFIFAIDWFMDRACTAMNVTGDSIVCGIVSQICPLGEEIENKVQNDLEAHRHFGNANSQGFIQKSNEETSGSDTEEEGP